MGLSSRRKGKRPDVSVEPFLFSARPRENYFFFAGFFAAAFFAGAFLVVVLPAVFFAAVFFFAAMCTLR
jgi:hypothetical protein